MTIQAGDTIFLDTNILLIATDESRKNHQNARQLFNQLLKMGINIGLSGQVIREYMVVSTRPLKVNGLGLSSGESVHNIGQFKQRSRFLDETHVTSELLQHLVVHYGISGKRIHDANIVATMKCHKINVLLTENPKDFNCFSDISVCTIKEFQDLVLSNDILK